jgi:hypothetical protein
MGVLSLLVKLGVDAAKFEMDLKRVQSLGEKFGTSFKNAVTNKLGQAFAASAVVGFTKHLMNAADEIKDLSEQLNLTTDEIQRLQILAGESGVSFEKFGSVLSKFEQIRIRATSGDKEAIRVINDLGLSVEDLSNKEYSNLNLAIRGAQAYKESGRSAQTTAAMVDIYGLKLKTAAAALAEYKSTEGRELISEETLDTLARGNNLFDEQIRRLKALSSKPLADGITATADAIKYLNDQNTDLAKAFNVKVTPSQIGATMLGNLPGGVQALKAASVNAPLPAAPPSPTNPPAIGETLFERVAGPKFSLGGSQDPLARIGGFTGFQSAQDNVVRQAIEQTLQLKQISKNTGKTADRISQE